MSWSVEAVGVDEVVVAVDEFGQLNHWVLMSWSVEAVGVDEVVVAC